MALMMSRKKSGTPTAAIIKIGSFTFSDTPPTLNVTSLVADYQNAVASDFFIANPVVTATASGTGSIGTTPSLAYNATTGIITVNGTVARSSPADAKCNGDVFYTKGGLPTA